MVCRRPLRFFFSFGDSMVGLVDPIGAGTASEGMPAEALVGASAVATSALPSVLLPLVLFMLLLLALSLLLPSALMPSLLVLVAMACSSTVMRLATEVQVVFSLVGAALAFVVLLVLSKSGLFELVPSGDRGGGGGGLAEESHAERLNLGAGGGGADDDDVASASVSSLSTSIRTGAW